MNKFTEQQLADYQAYEKVRESGKYNMFDPRASRAAKLPEDRYVFVMKNYTELRKEVENE